MTDKKGFIGRILDKLDGKLEQESKSKGCACESEEEEKKGCACESEEEEKKGCCG